MELNLNTFLIGITAISSFIGFQNNNYTLKYLFNPYTVKNNKEYIRLFSSGFLHADWAHLFVNMFVLWSFGSYVEAVFKLYYGNMGMYFYGAFYLISIILSNIPGQIRNQNKPYYNALGASGAVSAVLFAAIVFDPFSELLLFAIIPITAWIFGILYLAYSVYMTKKGGDNIDHLAHFAGAVVGLLVGFYVAYL